MEKSWNNLKHRIKNENIEWLNGYIQSLLIIMVWNNQINESYADPYNNDDNDTVCGYCIGRIFLVYLVRLN